MKLILTTELQLVALALKSIKGMTKKAGKASAPNMNGREPQWPFMCLCFISGENVPMHY